MDENCWARPGPLPMGRSHLSPCPFCGVHPHGKEAVHERKRDRAFFIVCAWCGAQGPIFGLREEAIKGWNERTQHEGSLYLNAPVKSCHTCIHNAEDPLGEQFGFCRRHQIFSSVAMNHLCHLENWHSKPPKPPTPPRRSLRQWLYGLLLA